MFESFMNEVPKVHVNIKRSFHTGSAQKKVEWPLKLLFLSDFNHRQATHLPPEHEKASVNKNDCNSTLSEYSSAVHLIVKKTLFTDGNKEKITLTFRDLKSNLLDNAVFCKELETVLKVPTPSDELHKVVKANLLRTTLKTRPKISTIT
ncbi:type VI secretion system contractile sheath small subunit [Photorhabdus caribbeanensis]|uniref:type VI secretion system contractile sheath small subunit n=1 Tax=Photorhabdus caribbeanensis TaxID=1004165 RepID=UPI001BD45CAA|nr:type VI secretion system contractile sheath small subunit [Photorhabdus caribbeanensis]